MCRNFTFQSIYYLKDLEGNVSYLWNKYFVVDRGFLNASVMFRTASNSVCNKRKFLFDKSWSNQFGHTNNVCRLIQSVKQVCQKLHPLTAPALSTHYRHPHLKHLPLKNGDFLHQEGNVNMMIQNSSRQVSVRN